MSLRDDIKQAFAATKTDKSRVHGYEVPYSKVFEQTPSSILEIGVKEGRSIGSWRILFPQCNIVGLDITDKEFIDEFVGHADEIIIGDSTYPEHASKVIGNFDVIIDDGSHHYLDIIETFKNFKDRFNRYYVIEDILFNHELILDVIKQEGFKVFGVFDSKTMKDVMVDKNYLVHNIKNKRSGVSYMTTLKMVVVTK